MPPPPPSWVSRVGLGLLLGVLWFAPPAVAKTLFQGTNVDLVASNPINVGLTLQAFTLTAVGKNGAIPTTFDSTNSGVGGTGIASTVTNALHQVWEYGAAQTPTATLIMPGGIPQAIDTHFLVNSGAIFSAVPPQENRLTPNPTEHPFAGFGNALTGVFSLPSQTAVAWDFAYVVAPVGAALTFNFQLAAPGFAADSVVAAWAFNFLPGDVNFDGYVNLTDVNVVGLHWQQNTRDGDANHDGIVNLVDVNMVGIDWGKFPAGASANVPEPAAALLAALAAALSAVARLVRSRRRMAAGPLTVGRIAW